MEKKEYGGLRLSREVLSKLSDVKLAFEVCYVKRMTNDEMVSRLIACIEDAEPGVWETYLEIARKKETENK